MTEGTIETPAGPLRVVHSTRAAGAVDVGDLVALVSTDEILGRPRLLELPTVRRLARGGLRSIVLVPVDEIARTFDAIRIPRDPDAAHDAEANPTPPDVLQRAHVRADAVTSAP